MTEFDPPFEVMHPSKHTVVFVDDEAYGGSSQQLMKRLLEKGCREHGMDLRVYTEVLMAKEFIEGNDHNKIILLTDNNMPDLTGAQLIYALEVQKKLPQTVLWSALSNEVGTLPAGVLKTDKASNMFKLVEELFSRREKLTPVSAPSVTPTLPENAAFVK